MQKYYWQSIIDYFSQMPMADVDAQSLHQLKRCFLDYMGCSIYTAAHHCTKGLAKYILSGARPGQSTVWFEPQKLDLNQLHF